MGKPAGLELDAEAEAEVVGANPQHRECLVTLRRGDVRGNYYYFFGFELPFFPPVLSQTYFVTQILFVLLGFKCKIAVYHCNSKQQKH